MRFLVTGDREWFSEQQRELVLHVLRQFIEGTNERHELIHGNARGVDSLAKEAALKLGIFPVAFQAPWDVSGRAAGPVRNQWMLDHGKPQIILAFHNNLSNSLGTKDMVIRAVHSWPVPYRAILYTQACMEYRDTVYLFRPLLDGVTNLPRVMVDATNLEITGGGHEVRAERDETLMAFSLDYSHSYLAWGKLWKAGRIEADFCGLNSGAGRQRDLGEIGRLHQTSTT